VRAADGHGHSSHRNGVRRGPRFPCRDRRRLVIGAGARLTGSGVAARSPVSQHTRTARNDDTPTHTEA
jgi:hypothetical protein